MIVQLEEAKQTLGTLSADVKELREALDYDKLCAKADELEKVTCEPEFWNREDAQAVMADLNAAKAKIHKRGNRAGCIGGRLPKRGRCLDREGAWRYTRHFCPPHFYRIWQYERGTRRGAHCRHTPV